MSFKSNLNYLVFVLNHHSNCKEWQLCIFQFPERTYHVLVWLLKVRVVLQGSRSSLLADSDYRPGFRLQCSSLVEAPGRWAVAAALHLLHRSCCCRMRAAASQRHQAQPPEQLDTSITRVYGKLNCFPYIMVSNATLWEFLEFNFSIPNSSTILITCFWLCPDSTCITLMHDLESLIDFWCNFTHPLLHTHSLFSFEQEVSCFPFCALRFPTIQNKT